MAFSNKWRFLKSFSSVKNVPRKPVEVTTCNTIVISVNGDTIGPPDPVSNLRPVIFHVPKNESHLEKQFRAHREAVQKWNGEFWTRHNEKFQTERSKFLKRFNARGDTNTITADEMSVFYKDFLDKHWETHLSYNMQWYKRNFHLILLAFKVELDNFRKRTLSRYL